MEYEILLHNLNNTQKEIGTDKGLAKIGDSIVNLIYSVAKSMYLTKINKNAAIIRTGDKVNKTILSQALKDAEMKDFAKNRGDSHDLANTVEAIVAYIWLSRKSTISEMIGIIYENLSGDITKRRMENENASLAFAELLKIFKPFLPTKKI
ncbi:MAG: hypothetical protein GF317_23605 [Candidatus Lokiarchaeota archaeon]|nr:hypothetical protein [Candidatus Lokiarchaeota archaeon]MBD3202358.1 hypothetical protein [Candidatus Lokiarchaeota archaeon]